MKLRWNEKKHHRSLIETRENIKCTKEIVHRWMLSGAGAVKMLKSLLQNNSKIQKWKCLRAIDGRNFYSKCWLPRKPYKDWYSGTKKIQKPIREATRSGSSSPTQTKYQMKREKMFHNRSIWKKLDDLNFSRSIQCCP